MNKLEQQIRIEKEAPEVVNYVEILCKSTWADYDSESIIYGLAEVINAIIDNQTDPIVKGKIVTHLTSNFNEFHKESLAEYRELYRAVMEAKERTIQ